MKDTTPAQLCPDTIALPEVGGEAGVQCGHVGQAPGVEFGVEQASKFGLAGPLMRQRQAASDRVAALPAPSASG